jgi:predicted TIM-barrel fold metal-dependent hydrolase
LPFRSRPVAANQIQQVTQLIAWWDRAPNVMEFEMGVPPKAELERALAELRKRAADLRRTGR